MSLIPTKLNLSNFEIKSDSSNGLKFFDKFNLPNASPNQNDILQFNSDGTAQFAQVSASGGVSAGLLRALNCNLHQPTQANTYNIVWSNLTDEEKLEWKGLDNSTADPVQSASGNGWSFVKNTVSSAKIGWYIPVDLSGSLTFQDLESFWAVIRFNSLTNISTEGSLYFQITTSPPTGLNYFRTRINYSNPATPMSQTGFIFKCFCLDTIPASTSASNTGKAQETTQTKFKSNPCNVRPDLFSLGFNKMIASPSGDLSSGFTSAPIQSISLQTSSNVNTFNLDLISFGYLDKQYILFYS
jgi:hypothetical protein